MDQIVKAYIQTEQTVAHFSACVAFNAKLRRVIIGESAAQNLHSSGSHGTAALLVTRVPALRMCRPVRNVPLTWARMRDAENLVHLRPTHTSVDAHRKSYRLFITSYCLSPKTAFMVYSQVLKCHQKGEMAFVFLFKTIKRAHCRLVQTVNYKQCCWLKDEKDQFDIFSHIFWRKHWSLLSMFYYKRVFSHHHYEQGLIRTNKSPKLTTNDSKTGI